MIRVFLQHLKQDFIQNLGHQMDVPLIHQSILEHPLTFMVPQFDQVFVVLQRPRCGLADPEKHLRNISQIKYVMTFVRSGQQFLVVLNLLVEFYCCLHDFLLGQMHLFLQVVRQPFNKEIHKTDKDPE